MVQMSSFNCIKTYNRMITVTDDWCPCYPGNQVELAVFMLHFTQCSWCDEHYLLKVSAWGMDDRGVEIERTTADHQEAIRIFNELFEIYKSVPDGVDLHWFCSNGFSPA